MKTLVIAIALACLSRLAIATADGPDHYRVSGVAAGSALNLRDAPGTGSAVIVRIPPETGCLRNLGCEGGLSFEEFVALPAEDKQLSARANPRWCKVEYRAQTGWVSARYLAEDACGPAAPDRQRITIDFPPGTDAVKRQGQLRGRTFIDYQLRAAAGQSLDVALDASHPANYFNLLPPGSDDAAMHIGQISGNRFNGMLPDDGDYTIRVYLMRSAARRNAVSTFALDVALTGTPLAPLDESLDARIPGTRYHAAATADCTIPYRAEIRECNLLVVRRGVDGTATVEVRTPDAYVRRILFTGGVPAASDSTRTMASSRANEGTDIRFGDDERVRIPDALLFGG